MYIQVTVYLGRKIDPWNYQTFKTNENTITFLLTHNGLKDTITIFFFLVGLEHYIQNIYVISKSNRKCLLCPLRTCGAKNKIKKKKKQRLKDEFICLSFIFAFHAFLKKKKANKTLVYLC